MVEIAPNNIMSNTMPDPTPSRPNRPIGITLLAALYVLGALLCFGFGAFVIVAGPELAAMSVTLSTLIGAVAWIFGISLIILGIIPAALAFGFIKGKKWSWWVAIIFLVIGLIFSIVSIITGGISSILSLAIQGGIIYYLTRSEPKKWFGF